MRIHLDVTDKERGVTIWVGGGETDGQSHSKGMCNLRNNTPLAFHSCVCPVQRCNNGWTDMATLTRVCYLYMHSATC